MKLVQVANAAQILPGSSVRVRVEAREIALFNRDGSFFAIKNICPHFGEQLYKGKVTTEGRVVCPGHAWHFDLKTGMCTSGPAGASVATYPVVVKDGIVYVEV